MQVSQRRKAASGWLGKAAGILIHSCAMTYGNMRIRTQIRSMTPDRNSASLLLLSLVPHLAPGSQAGRFFIWTSGMHRAFIAP